MELQLGEMNYRIELRDTRKIKARNKKAKAKKSYLELGNTVRAVMYRLQCSKDSKNVKNIFN